MHDGAHPPAPRATLLRDRNIAWLIGGGVISLIGDQFTLIALPWLVLQLTGDPRLLGMVVAMMGIPRAALILFGGALVDRYSPIRIAMLSKHVSTVLLGALAIAVQGGHPQLPLVLTLAAGLSLASAFAIPAGTAMLPHVVAPQQLHSANGMMMGLRQLTLLAGPLLAGLLFALGGDGRGHGRSHGSMHGLALAFGFDCLSFAISAWTLSKVATRPFTPAPPASVLRAVGQGLAAVWNDRLLRTCFLYWGLGAYIGGGIISVLLPLLANSRLHGATSLSLLLAAQGGGTLLGMALNGTFGARRAGSLGVTVLAIDAAVGLLLAALGTVTATWQGVLAIFAIGLLGGFVQVALFTWIQRRVASSMLGRTMSIFMFIFMGLAPMAAAPAGWLASRLSLPMLFAGAGGLLAGAALLAWLFSPLRSLADTPLPGAPTN